MIPAPVLDVVVRVPPPDVLGRLEEGEPPIQHAPLAAVQIGADGDRQQAVGAAGQAHFQAQRLRPEQLVDVIDAPGANNGKYP